MIFQVGTRTYAIHVGQNLKEAMAKPVKDEKTKEEKKPEEQELAPPPREALSEGR